MIAFSNDDPRFYSERRYQQLRRLFATLEVLAGFRRGAGLEEINADVNQAMGEDNCTRTTRRDLQFLLDAGLIVEASRGWFRTSGRLRFAAQPLNTPTARIDEQCDVGRQSGTRPPWLAAG